jgi:hypothetical protein
VFLIGARVNRWWLLPISLPILSKMNKMLRELAQDPESGLLAVQTVGLGATIQYWKSYDHLDRYAHDAQKVHRPTWTAYFARLFKNYAAGIWHETYLVRAGDYEAIYTNMPRRGLGLFKPLVPAQGDLKTSAARLGRDPS